MPVKRVALDLHDPQPASDWESRQLPWTWPKFVCNEWDYLFRDLALNCPLVKEILLVQDTKTLVSSSEPEDTAFKQASAAFDVAENTARMNNPLLIQDLKTEEECAESVRSAPRSVNGLRLSRWWISNPKLTFAKIEEGADAMGWDRGGEIT
jgi:hypothetical protein